MSLIDVVIGSAIVLVVFLGLIGLLRVSLLVSSLAKAKAGATAVADTQMEYVRSLPYDSVGTVGGIPAGAIQSSATTTVNGIAYATRTFIEYVDDPADGTDTNDTNGITTDYKRIKVAVTYSVRSKSYEMDMVSNYAPLSIETTTGGGTLKVAVVNASGAPVSGATVHIVNSTAAPAIDTTTFSDLSGLVLLGGAPASTDYQVYVSKAGYSSAQTYVRDTTNQNPAPGYLTVVANQTTTGTFAIDQLATLSLRTYHPIAATSTTDSFADASKLAAQTSTSISSGLTLSSDTNGYAASGSARSVAFAPANLVSWTTASTTLATPPGTTALVQVADSSGTLLPDSAVPGNSAGFSGSSINLSGVSTTTYPSLSLVATLSTTATSSAPTISSWSLNATAGPTPASGVSFTLTGAKTIGSTGASAPLYKTTVNGTTDSGGVSIQSLEWDSYSLAVSGYDVTDACSAPPYALSPGASVTQSLYVDTRTTNALLVSVRDSSGQIVSGATVTLSGASSASGSTSACGTAYFGSLPSGTYSITISKSGYTSTTDSNVSVSGHLFYQTSFP